MSDQPTQPELESVAPQLCMLVLAPRVVDSALFPLAIEMSQAEDPNRFSAFQGWIVLSSAQSGLPA